MSNKQKVISNKQKLMSNELKVTRNKQKVTSKEQKVTRTSKSNKQRVLVAIFIVHSFFGESGSFYAEY